MFNDMYDPAQEAFNMAAEANRNAKRNPMRETSEIVKMFGEVAKYLQDYEKWSTLVPELEKEIAFEKKRFMVAVDVMRSHGILDEFNDKCWELQL